MIAHDGLGGQYDSDLLSSSWQWLTSIRDGTGCWRQYQCVILMVGRWNLFKAKTLQGYMFAFKQLLVELPTHIFHMSLSEATPSIIIIKSYLSTSWHVNISYCSWPPMTFTNINRWGLYYLIIGTGYWIQVLLDPRYLSRFVSGYSFFWGFDSGDPGFESCIQQRKPTFLILIRYDFSIVVHQIQHQQICIPQGPGVKPYRQWGRKS